MPTDQKWEDMFTRIAAFRGLMVDEVGGIAALVDTIRDAGLDDIANELGRRCLSLGAGLEQLTREADGAQDETRDMLLGEVPD
jgi:hypothetical protein